MKKKLLLRLCLILMVTLSLYSCIHEEIISSTDPASTEYTNKSLWKQDEKYIKNVMKVYAEHETEIKKANGIPYWNFATTVDSFDESFVAVPVIDNGKVVSVLKVPRHGKNIYFYYTNETSDLRFFQGLVFAKYKKAEVPNGSIAQTDMITCTRQWMYMWYPDDESNPEPESGAGHWEGVSVIKCKQLKDECLGVINEFGQCDGGTNSEGYPYPGYGGGGGEPEEEEEEEEDPCKKIKANFADERFKNQFNALNTAENFSKDHEVGFYEKASVVNGSTTQSFGTTVGPSCGDTAPIPNVAGITGFGHTHNDNNCNNNSYTIRVPSADDIMIFLFKMVRQSYNYYGNYSNAYYLTVTSQGSYNLSYTGSVHPNNLSFNINKLRNDYRDLYRDVEVSTVSQDKIEKVFTKFLKEKVNIEGLEVYKVTPTSSEKLDYDPATKTMNKIPCPN
jgi:hypothetical protein